MLLMAVTNKPHDEFQAKFHASACHPHVFSAGIVKHRLCRDKLVVPQSKRSCFRGLLACRPAFLTSTAFLWFLGVSGQQPPDKVCLNPKEEREGWIFFILERFAQWQSQRLYAHRSSFFTAVMKSLIGSIVFTVGSKKQKADEQANKRVALSLIFTVLTMKSV